MCFHKQSPPLLPPSHALKTRFPFLPETELVTTSPRGDLVQVVSGFLLTSCVVSTKLSDYIVRYVRKQTKKKNLQASTELS